eukprot:3716300-Alexandrium_andersonii.AAC.1
MDLTTGWNFLVAKHRHDCFEEVKKRCPKVIMLSPLHNVLENAGHQLEHHEGPGERGEEREYRKREGGGQHASG